MTREIVLHLLAGLVSAAIWGFATRILFVPVAIVLSEGARAWFASTDRTRWGTARLLAQAILLGGTWAAIGLLVFGDCGRPS
jgi:hypothetical protein